VLMGYLLPENTSMIWPKKWPKMRLLDLPKYRVKIFLVSIMRRSLSRLTMVTGRKIVRWRGRYIFRNAMPMFLSSVPNRLLTIVASQLTVIKPLIISFAAYRPRKPRLTKFKHGTPILILRLWT